MNRPNKVLRSTALLTLGQVAGYGFSFVRNVMLARMLAKADFGLAAVFGMTLSLLEIAGRMSFGQQVIQSKAGDSQGFQATSHAFQLALSIAGSVLMLGLSLPLAHAFNAPKAAWAFSLLAIVPLARGFEHLDYYRRQREMDYLPAVLCELAPQGVITLAAWPLAVWLQDFRVIVWLMLGKAGLGILMTHLVARRPYRWAWQRGYVMGMWLFGWPLLLNGLLIFASQQADQVLVGAWYSLNDLAAYALVLSLVSIPWFIFGQVGSSIMLPLLARTQEDAGRFRLQYRACAQYAAVGAVVLTAPLIVAGEQLVALLYGPKYVGTGMLMAVLGATSAIRFLRFVPAVAAMARADTVNQLYSNLSRSISLPMAASVAWLGGGVSSVAACALAAEIVAGLVSVVRLRTHQSVPLRDTVGAATYVFGFVGVGLTVVLFGAGRWSNWAVAGGLLVLLALAVSVAWTGFPGFAQGVIEATDRKRVEGLRVTVPN